MGHHGWRGNPPATEEAARARIVDAARVCIDRTGVAKVNLSDVAAELGTTRQTVYRYFPGLDDILGAVAQAGVEDFATRMQQHLAQYDEVRDVAIESVVFAVTRIPHEKYLSLLQRDSATAFFTVGATSAQAFQVGAGILRSVPANWEEVGIVDDRDFTGLAEILMRLFISFLQLPGEPPRSEQELRELVGRWLGPALVP